MNSERTITIKAKASIMVLPDYAKLTFGLNEICKDSKSAFEKIQRKTSEIMNCVQSCGISLEDIKTEYLDSDTHDKLQVDRHGNRSFKQDGYRVSKTVSVGFFADAVLLEKVMKCVAETVESGNIFLSFSLRDRCKFELQVLKKLTEDAVKKANVMCEASNTKLGKLLSVHHQQNGANNFFRPALPPLRPPAPPMLSPHVSNDGETTMTTILNAAPPLSQPKQTPTPSPVPPRESLHPTEVCVEEEATFVWEIIDQ